MTKVKAETGGVRLDHWLWAARFFKTRQLCSAAISGGKIRLNGKRTKPAKAVRLGDMLEIRRGPYTTIVVIEALSNKRGSATDAATLYTETEQSIAQRQALVAQLRVQAQAVQYDRGRPSKRDRRAMQRLRRVMG